MEELILICLLIVATIYLIKHFKRTLTIGEERTDCSHCPVANPPVLSENKKST